jgi:O-antigen ligase
MDVLEKTSPPAFGARRFTSKAEPLKSAFFWLSAFYFVYCARPEDWIPGLKYIPLAKISGIFAIAGLLSAGRSKRSLKNLPREASYLFAIICLLLIAAPLSPVWKGGALFKAMDFAKVLVVWVLTYVVITSFERLKRIIFIQSASVAVIAVVSLLKGRNHIRLEGVIGGIYSNPNDLAFAIVLSLPFCIAFLLTTKKVPNKVAWLGGMLAMCIALFLTASRGGFVTLVFTSMAILWHFGIKGKRPQLIAAAALLVLVIGVTAGGRLKDRFFAISAENVNDNLEQGAHGSFEQRTQLMEESLKAVTHYPLGIGMGNFPNYSGTWREVHVSYLQIAAEGGIASLIFYILFFRRGFTNLKQLRKKADPDKETQLFVGALHSSLVGFLVGSLFAPEAYQYFPYFAVAYTSVLLAISNEKEQGAAIPAESLTETPWRKRFRTANALGSSSLQGKSRNR